MASTTPFICPMSPILRLMVPRTHGPSDEPASTDRQTLYDDLLELRNLMITVDVTEDDRDRDLHLRTALSDAVGAASSLASTSHAADSGVHAWPGVAVNEIRLGGPDRGHHAAQPNLNDVKNDQQGDRDR